MKSILKEFLNIKHGNELFDNIERFETIDLIKKGDKKWLVILIINEYFFQKDELLRKIESLEYAIINIKGERVLPCMKKL